MSTPVGILSRIVFTAHVCCVCATRSALAAAECKAFKHTMNFDKKHKTTWGEGNKMQGAQMVNEPRACRYRNVCSLRWRKHRCFFCYYFLEIRRARTWQKDSFWLNAWCDVHARHDQIILFSAHVNSGFDISDEPSWSLFVHGTVAIVNNNTPGIHRPNRAAQNRLPPLFYDSLFAQKRINWK